MNWQNAQFLGSWPELKLLPKWRVPEIALVGRSNVGKSSLINSLCQKPKLAKVSSTPGKTQDFVFFDIDSKLMFVDLPGYGYAKVSHSLKGTWEQIENYLAHRASACLLLIDIRHGLTELDKQFVQWLQHHQLPHLVILTKSDKLPRSQVARATHDVQRELSNTVLTTSEKDLASLDLLRHQIIKLSQELSHLPPRRPS